jgi:hypothetical protein
VCCGVLRCVAVCCGVLRGAAVFCGVLRCVAVCCGVLRCVAVSCLQGGNGEMFTGNELGCAATVAVTDCDCDRDSL